MTGRVRYAIGASGIELLEHVHRYDRGIELLEHVHRYADRPYQQARVGVHVPVQVPVDVQV
jgi:hypothetical protein